MSALLLTIAIHGWLDGYYAWNDRHPQFNFIPGTGTTAHRADEPALNVAALDIARDPKPVGFHVTLATGDSADIVHGSEAHKTFRYIYQASASYAVHGTTFEAGVYPSHIGFEGFFSKDNWNYTRGWLGEFSPYYQSGIKASRPFGKHWSAQVHLLRGWQNVTSHAPRAIGTQVAYDDGRTSATLNTYADPHRKFGDFIATYKITDKLTVATSIDRGRERPANWLGVAVWSRYALDARNAVAFRAERFRDPNAGISGFAQTINDATLTYETRPSPHLILKFEGRRDRSTAALFNDSRTERLAIASAVITY